MRLRQQFQKQSPKSDLPPPRPVLLACSGHGEYSGLDRMMEESSENEVLNGACRMFLVRKFFHVKIVCDGTPALLAKGYLGVSPYFRQWDALK